MKVSLITTHKSRGPRTTVSVTMTLKQAQELVRATRFTPLINELLVALAQAVAYHDQEHDE